MIASKLPLADDVGCHWSVCSPICVGAVNVFLKVAMKVFFTKLVKGRSAFFQNDVSLTRLRLKVSFFAGAELKVPVIVTTIEPAGAARPGLTTFTSVDCALTVTPVIFSAGAAFA